MLKLIAVLFVVATNSHSAWANDRFFELSLCSSSASTEVLALQSKGATVTKPDQLAFNSTRLVVQGYHFSEDHIIDMRLTFYKGRLMEIYIPIREPNWHRTLFMGGFAYFLSSALIQKYQAPSSVEFSPRGGVDARKWNVANGLVKITHQLNQIDNIDRDERNQTEFFTFGCIELLEARAEELNREHRRREQIQEQKIRDAAGKI